MANLVSPHKNKLFSTLITVFVVTILILSGPTKAIVLYVQTDKTVYNPNHQEIVFTLGVDIEESESVPVQNITLYIEGPVNRTCIFYPDGTAVSGCTNLTITRNSTYDSYAQGDGMFGYGYGRSPSSGDYATGNQTFGSGYGYASGSGYSWAGGNSELLYTVTWNITSGASAGSYTAYLEAFAQNGDNSRIYRSKSGDSASFTISSDGTAPNVNVNAPTNTTYGSLPITVNVTTNESAEWCAWNLDGGSNTTMSGSGTSWTGSVSTITQGTHRLYVYCNDSAGNMGSNSSIYFTYSYWWNSSFQYCKNITVSSAVNDYQYLLEITDPTNMNTDGSDVRIVNSHCSNGGSEVPLWVEKFNSTYGKVWFRGDNSSTTTYALYYGNNTPVSTKSDGDSTFYFFDDFEGDNYNYSEKWTLDSNCGSATLEASTDEAYAGSQSFHLACSEARYVRLTKSGLSFNNAVLEVSYKRTTSLSPKIQVFYASNTTQGTGADFREIYQTSLTHVLDFSDDPIIPLTLDEWLFMKFVFNGTTAYGFIKNETTGTWETTSKSVNGMTDMAFGDSWGGGASGTSDGYWDRFTVRKWTSSEPTASLGSLENAPQIQVSLNYPSDSSTNTSASISFGYTPVALNTQIYNCSLYTNSTGSWALNKSNSTAVTNSSVNSITQTFSDGTIIWNIGCYNGVEDFMGSSNRTLIIDTTGPVITISSPENTTYTSLPLDLNVTTSENASWCGWNLDSGSNTSLSGSGTAWWSSISSASEATHRLYVYCNDSHGNMGSGSLYFTYDPSGPKYYSNSTNSTYAGQPAEFRLRWTDNVGLSGYVFSFDNGSGFSNDTWTAFSPGGTADWSNVTKTVNSTVGTTIQWKVYANDTGDNWNTSETYSFVTTDGTNPVVLALNYPGDHANSSTASTWFNVTAYDETGVDSCTLYINSTGTWQANTSVRMTNNTENGTQLTLAEGVYIWNYLCNDTSGNTDWYGSNYTLTTDLTSPAVSIDSPSDASYHSSAPVISGTATETWLKNCTTNHTSYGSADTTSPFNFTNTSALSESTHHLKVTCYDWSGRSGTDTVYFTYDATSPAISITSPANTTYTSLPLDLNITTNEAASWCGWNLDGSSNNSMSGSGTAWWSSISSASEATHRLYVYCNDSAGNSAVNSSVYFTYYGKPRYWDNSTNSTYAGQPVEFRLRWTDDAGLSGYVFSFCNGSNCTETTYTMSYQEDANSTGYNASAAWKLGQSYSKVYDGNWSSYGEGTNNNTFVYVNYTKPSGAVGSSLWKVKDNTGTANLTIPSACWSQSTLQFRIYSNEPGGAWDCYNGSGWSRLRSEGSEMYEEGIFWNVSSSRSTWTNDTWTAMTGTGNWSNVTKTVNSTVGTTIQWKVYANDTGDNWNTSQAYSFVTTDGTLPTITVTSPANTSYSTIPISLNVTVSENASWCGWNINGTANSSASGSGTAWWSSISCPAGTHRLYVYCNDSAGNMGSNSTVYFTYTTTTTTTTSGGGGGGGGGGAATTSTTTTTTVEEEEEEGETEEEEPKALFDINAEIATEQVTENELVAKVTLINFGEPGLVNATVYYTIRDSAGNVVYEETEIVPVETQVEYLKSFDVSRFGDDDYTLTVDLEYQGQKEPAKSERDFSVSREPQKGVDWSVILLTLAAVFVVIVAYLKRHEIFKLHEKEKNLEKMNKDIKKDLDEI